MLITRRGGGEREREREEVRGGVREKEKGRERKEERKGERGKGRESKGERKEKRNEVNNRNKCYTFYTNTHLQEALNKHFKSKHSIITITNLRIMPMNQKELGLHI